jgi:hypothetical protein
LEGLSSTIRASDLDIQVSMNEVKIDCPLNCFEKGVNQTEKISLKAINRGKILVLNGSKTCASLKKKQGRMLITIGCDVRKVSP